MKKAKNKIKEQQYSKADAAMKLLEPEWKEKIKVKKIIEDIGDKKSALLVENQKDYPLTNALLTSELSDAGFCGIYVSINKGADDIIKQTLKAYGKKPNAIFIDCISKISNREEVKEDNIIYFDSPNDLEGISYTIESKVNSLGDRKRFIIIDSVSTLLIYNKETAVEKFIHSICNKYSSIGILCIIVCVHGTADSIIQNIAQFCDICLEI